MEKQVPGLEYAFGEFSQSNWHPLSLLLMFCSPWRSCSLWGGLVDPPYPLGRALFERTFPNWKENKEHCPGKVLLGPLGLGSGIWF